MGSELGTRIWEGQISLTVLQPLSCPSMSCMDEKGHGQGVYQPPRGGHNLHDNHTYQKVLEAVAQISEVSMVGLTHKPSKVELVLPGRVCPSAVVSSYKTKLI